jgi:hypothetical protein
MGAENGGPRGTENTAKMQNREHLFAPPKDRTDGLSLHAPASLVIKVFVFPAQEAKKNLLGPHILRKTWARQWHNLSP